MQMQIKEIYYHLVESNGIENQFLSMQIHQKNELKTKQPLFFAWYENKTYL